MMRTKFKRLQHPLCVLVLLAVVWPCAAIAADGEANLPLFSIDVDQNQSSGKVGVVMQIFLLLTILSLAPSILVMLTSFTRIAIVLSLLRQAIGSNQIPPSQIIIGLSLFLTFFIMTPVWQTVHQEAVKPYLANDIDAKQALEKAMQPVRKFMLKQTREKDLSMMVQVAKMQRPKNIDDVPTHVLIPSFIISELKTAFQIGFMLYVPFLIIDMVVASVLLSMGMMMLPPVMVSLPFKLMIFVLIDGWYLIVGSLVKSFTG
jgi:flagellar biosynthetic protein FliP